MTMLAHNTRTRKLVAAVVAAVAVVAAGLSAPTPAQAQSGNVVTFGDSYTSSPDEWLNGMLASPLPTPPPPADYPMTAGCLQSPYNWPRQLADKTGLEVDDWSCTAQNTAGMLGRIDHAIEEGVITPSTRAVIFSVGGNDFTPAMQNQGPLVSSTGTLQAQHAQQMRQAADKVRSVAPGAQLVVSGYPQVTNGYAMCFVHLIPNLPLGVPLPGAYAEQMIRDMQRQGAAAAGMDFVDNYALTAGHDTCSRDDDQRYVSGIVDFTSPAYEMAVHPTNLGHAAIAAHNARALGFTDVTDEAPEWAQSASMSSALSSTASSGSSAPMSSGSS
ncbi:secreted esterase A [Corynebacterium maris DSM 45190]|uniref:Secreted esterase A n=2 Tax=Corynebacterium TaxID=1716 RepID=S5SU67_9CORY|nr:secreted esterase A [Corynebacterium maris DSM 45190]